MEKEKIPFCTINFVNKTGRHAQFESWFDTILTRPGIKAKLTDLWIIRAIT